MNEVTRLLKKHKSIRQYKADAIPEEQLHEMIHAAQHAASSNFVQAYSIVRVTEPDKIDALATLSKNEKQIKSAPVVLLFCCDLKRLEYACRKQGVEMTSEGLENFIVGTVDTALFAQNFVVAAESLGYGICYIGGVRNNPEQISELVNLPDKVYPVFGMTVGVPDQEQFVKPRLPVEAILHENQYDETKYEQMISDYDQTMSEYYQTRLTNRRQTTWSETMSNMMRQPRRQHMKEFIEKKGFKIN
ncbi:oxygen-insensitive NADPH nitroreductase [Piscibacillus halophilus]|uniref:Nitroreductase n=1 Tax=Piscibacillus halophilus TaxID=571933 RepID=A0A1H9KEW5_9BACI|nr:oxygen-insensitive NADPH nitroreductase [Piscibacillus halophilus]SEQ97652.1 Nitroreductase [Piscibacillus halophilus]